MLDFKPFQTVKISTVISYKYLKSLFFYSYFPIPPQQTHEALDAYEFEGDVFGAEDENINAIFEDTEMIDKLHIAMEHLSAKQKALIKAIYFDNMKARDYAVKTGVSKAAISQQLKTALKKLKKYL